MFPSHDKISMGRKLYLFDLKENLFTISKTSPISPDKANFGIEKGSVTSGNITLFFIQTTSAFSILPELFKIFLTQLFVVSA